VNDSQPPITRTLRGSTIFGWNGDPETDLKLFNQKKLLEFKFLKHLMKESAITVLTWYRAVIPVYPDIINPNFQRGVGDNIYSISLPFYATGCHTVWSINLNTRLAW
jgi:hypothetical protein